MQLIKKEIILFISLFSFIVSKKNESIIIFPFKIISNPFLIDYPKDNNRIIFNNNSISQNYNSSKFFDDHYLFKILSPIKIGEPPQDITTFINIYEDKLLIGELINTTNNIFPYSFNKGYKYEKSSTFKNFSLEKDKINNESKKFLGEENIYLFTSINNIKKNKYSLFSNFKFNVENKITYDNNSFIGLIIGLCLSDNYYEINFMSQIYERNIISKYIVSFEYTNSDEGIIIIGKYPHEVFPEIYSEEEYKSFYSYQPRTLYLTNFVVNFNEIFSVNNNLKYNLKTKATIILNSGLIIGINEYMEFIEKYFFNEYINLNICKKHTTNSKKLFIIFYCIENENLNFENFPILHFNLKSENLIFEFNYKDLFKKIENEFYFMIVFEKYSTIWRLGKPFFLKYTFVYNGGAKTIGFYQKKNELKIKEKSNYIWKIELNIIKIILIIILFLIFILFVIIIAYYLGKKYNLIRKKHANELDDDYDYFNSIYSSKSKDINNKNNKKTKGQYLELRDESKFN